MNILAISGHPNLKNSQANSVILEHLAKEGVVVRKLDELAPNFKVNVAEEQAALLAADVIVFVFPLYWFSVPALLKQWIDDVFAYGFAFGSGGSKLSGKSIIFSITIGGAEEAYKELAFSDLLLPLERMAIFSEMKWQDPILSFGIGRELSAEKIAEISEEHATRLIEAIRSI